MLKTRILKLPHLMHIYSIICCFNIMILMIKVARMHIIEVLLLLNNQYRKFLIRIDRFSFERPRNAQSGEPETSENNNKT